MFRTLIISVTLSGLACLASAQQSQQQERQQSAQQVIQSPPGQQGSNTGNTLRPPMPPRQSAGDDTPPVATLPVILPTDPQAGPSIDLVICLDTSGSMSGLINAARQKLWDIVNDLALADPTPSLRVALLTFGNDAHNPEDGWVKIDAPLTDNLDVISERLFALTTNGGSEYVGRVVHHATEQLGWHPSEDAMRLMIVAGNESAEQDLQVSFRDACKAAITKGIMINSIYCGAPTDAEAPAWREVSQLADGHFATIDHDNGTVVITSPFDDRLAELSAALNVTYLPYGEHGRWNCMNQSAQDDNALSLNSAAAASRVQTKASSLYRNDNWDLVDGCKNGVIKLEDVKEADLPEVMKPMTHEERVAYVEKMATERAVLQKEAQELSAKRTAHVENELKSMAAEERARSFDHVVRQAVRTQATAKGYTFEQSESPVDTAETDTTETDASDGDT